MWNCRLTQELVRTLLSFSGHDFDEKFNVFEKDSYKAATNTIALDLIRKNELSIPKKLQFANKSFSSVFSKRVRDRWLFGLVNFQACRDRFEELFSITERTGFYFDFRNRDKNEYALPEIIVDSFWPCRDSKFFNVIGLEPHENLTSIGGLKPCSTMLHIPRQLGLEFFKMSDVLKIVEKKEKVSRKLQIEVKYAVDAIVKAKNKLSEKKAIGREYTTSDILNQHGGVDIAVLEELSKSPDFPTSKEGFIFKREGSLHFDLGYRHGENVSTAVSPIICKKISLPTPKEIPFISNSENLSSEKETERALRFFTSDEKTREEEAARIKAVEAVAAATIAAKAAVANKAEADAVLHAFQAEQEARKAAVLEAILKAEAKAEAEKILAEEAAKAEALAQFNKECEEKKIRQLL